MSKRLSIIVVEKDRDRALTIVDGLREAGDHEVLVLADLLRFGSVANLVS